VNAIETTPGTIETAQGTTQADAVRAPRSAWFSLGAILIISIFGFVDRQVLTLVAAPMSKALQITDAQLGLVQGLAFAVFALLATYPLAWAADRFDRRWILGFCIALWSVGTAACGLAQNFTQLFLAAVAIAAGEAGVGPIALSMIPDLFEGRERVLANSINYFAAYLGVAVALILGGAAISGLDSVRGSLPAVLQPIATWRIAFFLVAAPAPLCIVLAAFTRLRRGAHANVTSDGGGHIDLLPFLRNHASALLLIFVGLALFSMAFGGFLVWLPVAAARLFGVTPVQNGLGMGLATGCGMISGVLTGTLLLRRYSTLIGAAASIRIGWVALLATTPVMLLFPFVTSATQAYVLMGMLMFSGTLFGCLVPNILQSLAPPLLRARIFGIYGIVSVLIGGVSPSIVGVLSDRIGGPRALLFALAIAALPPWIISTILLRMSEQPFIYTATAITASPSERKI
jgi:MFS family permease